MWADCGIPRVLWYSVSSMRYMQQQHLHGCFNTSDFYQRPFCNSLQWSSWSPWTTLISDDMLAITGFIVYWTNSEMTNWWIYMVLYFSWYLHVYVGWSLVSLTRPWKRSQSYSIPTSHISIESRLHNSFTRPFKFSTYAMQKLSPGDQKAVLLEYIDYCIKKWIGSNKG